MVTYNINELLERKNELEVQVKELAGLVTSDVLKYRKEIRIDHTNGDKKSECVLRPKVTLTVFTQKVFGRIDELEKIKILIQKYNAENVLGEIQKRESARNKIGFLNLVKKNLPRDTLHNRDVSREDPDGVALESLDVTTEPMFPADDVDVMHDQFAAQERKINTSIQKKNLEAVIEI